AWPRGSAGSAPCAPRFSPSSVPPDSAPPAEYRPEHAADDAAPDLAADRARRALRGGLDRRLPRLSGRLPALREADLAQHLVQRPCRLRGAVGAGRGARLQLL